MDSPSESVSVRPLFRFLRPYRFWIALAPVAMGIEAAMDLAQPAFMKRIVDEGVGAGDLGVIRDAGWTMLLFALVGSLGWKTEGILSAIESSPRRDRIRRLGGIRDDQLAAVYAGAAAFVYPTRYEGFGFPPLEAMARGVPVVSARNSSLPEVLGDAPRWVDGFDTAGWAAAIRAVLADPEGRAAMRRAGMAQAGRYTWSGTARETWAVYRRAAGMAR